MRMKKLYTHHSIYLLFAVCWLSYFSAYLGRLNFTACIAAINEAVAGVYPGALVTVEREYKNALQGFALRAPAGSLEAIRGVSGVSAAFLERETYVQ